MGEWRWKLMFRIPGYAAIQQVRNSATGLQDKGKMKNKFEFHIESIEEGKWAQVMHMGPYEKVSEVYSNLDVHMKNLGMERNGPFHEIYISDPARTEPEKLKQ